MIFSMENRIAVKKHISTWIPTSITLPRQLATTNILTHAPTKAVRITPHFDELSR